MNNTATFQRGFTLVELLVASIMTVFVAGATISTISHAARARAGSAQMLEASSRAGAAIGRLRDDLRATVRDHDLYFATLRIEPGARAGRGSDDSDRLLLFVSSLQRLRSDGDQAEADHREVQYRIGGAGEERDALWRREDPIPDEYRDGGGVATPIAFGVTSFRVEALDGETWERAWDSDYDGYPNAVRVTVTAADDTGTRSATRRAVIALDRTPRPLDVLLDEHLEEIGAEPLEEEAS